MLTAKKQNKTKQKQKTLCIKFDHSIVAYNKLGKKFFQTTYATPTNTITYPDATQINTVNLFIIVYDYDIFINVTISFSVKIDASFELLGHVKSEFLFYLLEF